MELGHAAVKQRPSRIDDALLDESLALNGRYVHLDVTRICCIVCVVVGTFDPRHYEWNTLYAQSWVPQLAWLVSGICFSLTKRPLLMYLRRVLAYLAIGAVVNSAAWMINEWSWETEVWFVGHQMNFVLCVLLSVPFLAPLKNHLKEVAAKDSRSTTEALPKKAADDHIAKHGGLSFNADLPWGVFVIAGGVAVIDVAFCLALCPALHSLCALLSVHGLSLGFRDMRTEAKAGMMGKNIGYCLATICCGLWIVLAFPRLFKSRGAVAWLLLANLYIHRLACGYGPGTFLLSGFYLMLVAVTAVHLGLAYRQRVGQLVHRYWMVVVFALRFCCTPGLHGALISHPPPDLYDRQRYILVEALLVVAWLTAGQHMVDPAIFTHDGLGWVNMWALAVFPVFLGTEWLVPWPLSWLVLLGMGPLCWLCHRSD
mmetsp:Transcript_158190/g.484655  ORF Transcript_158190/g.484655 Transcript_158190/m.484655 type:complete len:427 (+) Transcript_158190:66-1346(+)